jgi:site-specific recombinase XerD
MTPTIDLAIREFLLACRADGLAPATVRWYRDILKFAEARFTGRTLSAISTADLREHLVELRERAYRYRGGAAYDGGLSAESIRNHVRALKRFFNWCIFEYRLSEDSNPMRGIRIPNKEKREPKAISLDDLKTLLEACDESDVMQLRDKTMIAFLADTGCRAGGMLSLHAEDLHLADGYATVQEKGHRRRTVPFTEYTAELLSRWLSARPNVTSGLVFYSMSPRYVGQQMTVFGLHRMLVRLKERTGIAGRVNPHSFRHGFARQYLINGGDLATLAQLMGHSNVNVTASSYAVFQDAELRRSHDKFSPIRSIKPNASNH